MVQFLYVRHGHTLYNESYILQGRQDIPLSELGVSDAKETKKALKDYKIDEIYTSPLKRAYQTAEIINEDRDVPLHVANELIEMNYGDLEGTSLLNPELPKMRERFFTRFPNGENYFEVVLRIYPFLKSIEDKYKNEDKTILLVSHMGVYRVIKSYFMDMTNEEFGDCYVKNCAVIEFPKRGEAK